MNNIEKLSKALNVDKLTNGVNGSENAPSKYAINSTFFSAIY